MGKAILGGLAAVLMAGSLYAQDLNVEQEALKAAKPYLEGTCKDGEQGIIYSPKTKEITNITMNSYQSTLDFNDGLVKPLCSQPELYSFHCHPNNDPVSDFPSPPDMANAANLEIICGAEARKNNFEPPKIYNYLINTGKKSEMVNYGFKNQPARLDEFIRIYSADLSKAPMSFSNMGTDVNKMLKMVSRENLEGFFKEVRDAYSSVYVNFLIESCKSEIAVGEVEKCPSMNSDAMIKAVDASQDYFARRAIILPEVFVPEISSNLIEPTLPEKLGQFPWFTELGPKDVPKFIKKGKSWIEACSFANGNEVVPGCRERIGLMARYAGECGGLKVGVIDLDKHPDLGIMIGMPGSEKLTGLYHNGVRFVINIPGEISPRMFGMIACGSITSPNSGGWNPFGPPSASSINPLQTIQDAIDAMKRAQRYYYMHQ